MDRKAALALVLVAAVMTVVGLVAWAVPTPLDPYRTVLLPDGTRSVLFDPSDPVLQDMGLLVREGLHQALRSFAPLVVVLALGSAGALAVVNRPVRWVRPFAVLLPLGCAGAVGALCFTPPDVITTAIFLVAAQGGLGVLGLVALAFVGGFRPVSD